jgi:hypothetical protein
MLSEGLCVYESTLLNLNAWTNLYDSRYVRVYSYHGTWTHLNGVLHKFLPSVCVLVCVSLLSLLGNVSVNCNPLSVKGNNSAKTFPWQWRIIGGIVLYLVYVVSKESRRLIFPRTSYSVSIQVDEERSNYMVRNEACIKYCALYKSNVQTLWVAWPYKSTV